MKANISLIPFGLLASFFFLTALLRREAGTELLIQSHLPAQINKAKIR